MEQTNFIENGPVTVNLELTTKCPLRCPQCYVYLDSGVEMPKETALYWIRDAAGAGVRQFNLAGGETLSYPHLTELIREIHRLGMASCVALSGAYVTREKLEELIDAGVTGIFVSLNGSTEEVNSLTRDAYGLAIHTLELLKDIGFKNRYINWVMHSCNADDFPNMIRLAEKYEVYCLAVLSFKPDSSHELKSFPTAEQIRTVARQIREYKGPVQLEAEPCFSQLRTIAAEDPEGRGNTNTGIRRGCGAGRRVMSVSADGKLIPCRHIMVKESYDHILDYWRNSPLLNDLRHTEERREKPCLGCRWEETCLPCMAIGPKLHGELRYGMEECPIRETR